MKKLFMVIIVVFFFFVNLADGQLNYKKEKFRYLGTNTYSCGGVTNSVREYQHNQTGIDFVLLPGGLFLMGSNLGAKSEKPRHYVKLDPFLISKHTITQKVWKKWMRKEPWKKEKRTKQGDMYPATCVSWKEVSKFCSKFNFDLPTEAQWEYACRAGTKTNFYWGNQRNDDFLWYDNTTINAGESYAHEVGTKKTNAFGLFDMSGNVYEWCKDLCYWDGSKKLVQTTTYVHGIINPVSKVGNCRVVRGGYWGHPLSKCRSAHRRGSGFAGHYSRGFRIVAPVSVIKDINKVLLTKNTKNHDAADEEPLKIEYSDIPSQVINPNLIRIAIEAKTFTNPKIFAEVYFIISRIHTKYPLEQTNYAEDILKENKGFIFYIFVEPSLNLDTVLNFLSDILKQYAIVEKKENNHFVIKPRDK